MTQPLRSASRHRLDEAGRRRHRQARRLARRDDVGNTVWRVTAAGDAQRTAAAPLRLELAAARFG